MSEKIKPTPLNRDEYFQNLARLKATAELSECPVNITRIAVNCSKYRYLSQRYPELAQSLSQKIAVEEGNMVETIMKKVNEPEKLILFLNIYREATEIINRLQNPEEILTS